MLLGILGVCSGDLVSYGGGAGEMVRLPGVIRQDRPCGYSPTVPIFKFFPGPGKIVLACS